jgi:glutaconate CoA-transferase subunit A
MISSTIKEAVKKVKDNSTIGLSGFSYMNPPMALVREIIKKGVKGLRLVSGPTSGIETDILIGAGCVSEVVTACVAFEKIAGVAPNFRKFAEQGKIKIWECDESIWHIALKAGIEGKPYLLWPGAVGTSIPQLNKSIKEVRINNRYYLKVPAIKLDLGIVHCGFADKNGNASFPENLFLKREFCEHEISKASRETIVSVEKVVSEVEKPIIKNAFVVEAEFGCHPGASNGYYIPDLGHYREYVRLCKEGKFEKYLDRYVFGIGGHEDYLSMIGRKRLNKLRLRPQ